VLKNKINSVDEIEYGRGFDGFDAKGRIKSASISSIRLILGHVPSLEEKHLFYFYTTTKKVGI
jgi:hypothetical protein